MLHEKKILSHIRLLTTLYNRDRIYSDLLVVTVFKKRPELLHSKEPYNKSMAGRYGEIQTSYTTYELQLLDDLASMLVEAIEAPDAGDVLDKLYKKLF